MKIRAKEIADYLERPLIGENIEVEKPASFDAPVHQSILYVKKITEEELAELANYKVLVLLPEYNKSEQGTITSGQSEGAFIYCANPRLAFAKVVSEFFEKKRERRVESSAIISENVTIGENVAIGRNSVIEEEVVLGDGTIIEDNVIVRYGVVLGSNCWIKSGAVLGQHGFGYEFEEDGVPVRIPHSGTLVIGDQVDIGSNTVICRGTIDDTRIEEKVKINDLVHIAHNCKVGRNTIIAGGKLCGSVVLKDNVWIAPGSIVKNKVTIGAGTMIGLGSVVVGDITGGVVAFGNPALVKRKRDLKE